MAHVPKSNLVTYIEHNHKLKISFFKQMYLISSMHSPFLKADGNIDKTTIFYSSKQLVPIGKINTNICVSASKVVIDYTKDATGNKITKEHKLFELSDVITGFKSGEKTTLANKQTRDINLEDYFKNQGIHFCAGYLSKFDKLYNNSVPLDKYFMKLKESKAYSVAVSYWNMINS